MSIHDKIISAFGMLRDIIAGKAEKSDIAPEFSTSSTYGEGSIVMKDGTLYRCTSLHSGAWDASHFSATTVDGALAMIPQSDKVAEETDADVHDVIDAEYTVVNPGDTVEVHIAAEDPYASAEEMSHGYVSTALLKGDVKICGISVCDIKNIEDASYMFAGNTGIKKCTVPDWFNPGEMDYMFKMCTSLEQVDFSNHEIRIDDTRNTYWSAEGMFLGCSNLSSVCMDEEGYSSIKFCSRFGSIRDFFKGCYSLDKVKFRATYHLSDVPSEGDYAIAAEIKSASGLFSGCINLTEAHIEGFSLGYFRVGDLIGEDTRSSLTGMFDGCYSLRSISFKLVSGYENEAFLPFSGLKSLESVTLDSVFYMGSSFDPKWFDGTPLKKISILYSFSETYFDSTLLPKALTSVEIVSSFKWGSSKEFDAFRSNNNIESITLRGGFMNYCTNLTGAFMDCSSLSKAEIMSSESSYANYMFKGCTSLLSCKVDGMIGGNSDYPDVIETFYGCGGLTSLKLPECFGEGATSANRCFGRCVSLTTIDAKKIGSSSDCIDYSSCFNMDGPYGTAGHGSAYKIVVSSSFGTQQGADVSECFRGCNSLTTCSLPGTFGVLSGSVYSCFHGCWAYKPSLSADFGKSATYVYSCFNECQSIDGLDLSGGFGSNVDSVECCFNDCINLSTLNLRADFGSKASLVDECFRYCHKLTSLPKFSGFGSKAVSFRSCFEACRDLKSLSLPDDFGSKAEFVDLCFDKCTKLESITAIKFPVSFSLACCPLTAESAKIVLNGLVDVSNKTTQTLELSYTTLESLSEEDISIASDKNWSVVTGTCNDE